MAEQRVFFGLRPARATREALLALPRDLGIESGRLQHVDDVHMTLVFIGQVEEACLSRLRELAIGVSGARVELNMDRLEYWRRPRIACAGLSSPPPALLDLQRRLARTLRDAGFVIESRAYRPHVTLVRKAPPFEAIPIEKPLHWNADRFLLYASVSDGRLPRYRPIETFSLGGS